MVKVFRAFLVSYFRDSFFVFFLSLFTDCSLLIYPEFAEGLFTVYPLYWNGQLDHTSGALMINRFQIKVTKTFSRRELRDGQAKACAVGL